MKTLDLARYCQRRASCEEQAALTQEELSSKGDYRNVPPVARQEYEEVLGVRAVRGEGSGRHGLCPGTGARQTAGCERKGFHQACKNAEQMDLLHLA